MPGLELPTGDRLRRTCSQVHRVSDKRDTGLRRTGRLAEVAGGAWGLRPRKAPLGARAQSARGCFRADCHSLRRLHPISRLSEPLWTTPHTKKGTVPFFKGLIPSTSHTTPLRTSTSTQENGSRCAAQRVGGRLAVVRRKETAERVPLASTCVACRSPVIQLEFAVPRDVRLASMGAWAVRACRRSPARRGTQPARPALPRSDPGRPLAVSCSCCRCRRSP